jgi:phosphoribosylglycinamide formyltransferase-1
MQKKLKIAVLISGSGSNLQSLIESCRDPLFPAKIVCVISNKKDAYGLERAKLAGINHFVVEQTVSKAQFEEDIHNILLEQEAELICLAGFMRILSASFIETWADKIINIHPSLLPSFKGLNAQKQALEAGVKIAGCTVHYVVSDVDAGAIIIQAATNVFADDTVETLTKRILVLEHHCLPYAVKLIAEKQLLINNQVTHSRQAKGEEFFLINPAICK